MGRCSIVWFQTGDLRVAITSRCCRQSGGGSGAEPLVGGGAPASGSRGRLLQRGTSGPSAARSLEAASAWLLAAAWPALVVRIGSVVEVLEAGPPVSSVCAGLLEPMRNGNSWTYARDRQVGPGWAAKKPRASPPERVPAVLVCSEVYAAATAGHAAGSSHC